jgi:hypothetical protein
MPHLLKGILLQTTDGVGCYSVRQCGDNSPTFFLK